MSNTSPYRNTAYTNGYEFTQGSGYSLPQYPFVPPADLNSSTVARYPIVIVGAGLSGLTLACALAQLGVACVVLDEDNSVGVKGASSRGICYTQKSLEIFQRLGLYQRIAARGVQWSVGRTFAGRDEVYSFDLREQSAYNLSAQPPFINIQQFYLEGYLVERVAELGHADLRWNNRVVDFSQNDSYATLTVDTPAGRYQLQADHVIDACGSHTPFRHWLQVQTDSQRGDDRWCIADVRFTQHPPVERHTWVQAPFNEGRAVWQHLMADQVWRIDYQMAPDSDPATVSREDVVRERLARQFGADTQVEIVWVGPYAYRSDCARQARYGRVFLMGDTLKIVSPFGARGGNSGIADADNLAWKLAAILRGLAPPKLLDSYHQERHEAACQNVLVTRRTARFLRPTDGPARLLREAVLSLAKQYAFARALVNTGRMAVANSYSASSLCGPGGGLSVQNVALTYADGSPGTLNDLLRWAQGRLLLLVFGRLDANAQKRLRDLSQQAPVLAVQVLAPGQRADAREHVRDHNARGVGHLQGACHVFGHAWALLRPDSYLAASGEAIDASVVQALARALALPGD